MSEFVPIDWICPVDGSNAVGSNAEDDEGEQSGSGAVSFDVSKFDLI